MAHDYVPGLKQWFSTKGIKNSYDSWHGMLLHENPIMQERHNDPLSFPLVDLTFFLLFIYLFSSVSLCFCCESGKGVKKAIKKVASGLVRDAEKSCLQNCLTKVKWIRYTIEIVDYCLILHDNEISRNILFQSNVQRRTSTMQ